MSGDPEEFSAPSGETRPVESPFAHAREVTPRRPTGQKGKLPVVLAGGVIVAAALAAGIFLGQRASHSARTVKEFPIENYFNDYHAVAGGTFKTEAAVAVDLGWKAESGRMMAFASKDGGRRFVVLLPPALADAHFAKGQRYRIVFKVLEGGLLYADSCSKL